jgi:nuclear protein localization family protein 4
MLSRGGLLVIWVLGESFISEVRFEADERHGMLLFLSYKPIGADPNSHPSTEASTSTPHPKQPDPAHPHTHTERPLPNMIPLVDLSKVVEPQVDQYWSGQKGKIERKRDPILCRHGDKAMCDHCMPLEVSFLQ